MRVNRCRSTTRHHGARRNRPRDAVGPLLVDMALTIPGVLIVMRIV